MSETPAEMLDRLTRARAEGPCLDVERALCAVMVACLEGLDEDLHALWGRVCLGRCPVETARAMAKRLAHDAGRDDAPPGAMARALAAVAVVHAHHALTVARSFGATLSTPAVYRLRVSLRSAYRCADDAAELTPRSMDLSDDRVKRALRDAVGRAAA